MITAALFTGCSSRSNTIMKDNKIKTVNVTENSERDTPEETVKSYYSSEVNKNAEFLSKYFVNPQMSEVGSVKKKLNAFKVDKMEVVKLFNVKKQGNYAVIICSFNTYFKGIEKPRPDIEVVSLVNNNGNWYILNDYGSVSDNDMKWLNDANEEQKKFVSENKAIQTIVKQNQNFDKVNSAFIDSGKKAMLEIQNTNSSF